MTTKSSFQDFRFLVPLLALPYPVYYALRVAMNQMETERMLRFVDWVCRENSIQRVETRAYGNVKDYEWQGRKHRICLQMITASYGEEIQIFTRTWIDDDWKTWRRRLQWKKWTGYAESFLAYDPKPTTISEAKFIKLFHELNS